MNIRLTPHALRQLNRMNDEVADAIRAALDRLAEEDQSLDVRKLSGELRSYRVRVGDYRVIFNREDGIDAVVTSIAHRRDVYRGR